MRSAFVTVWIAYSLFGLFEIFGIADSFEGQSNEGQSKRQIELIYP